MMSKAKAPASFSEPRVVPGFAQSLPREGSQGADISMVSCNCTTARN